MTLTKEIREQAEVTETMTIKEAKKLPNMKGILTSMNLEHNGFYAYTAKHDNGTETKTLVLLAI